MIILGAGQVGSTVAENLVSELYEPTSARAATELIIGSTRQARLMRIEEALKGRAMCERWAVLITSAGLVDLPAPNGVVVRKVTGGCACCIGSVVFRVALTKLLREARCDRLLIELSADDHTERAIAMLRDEWFAKAIALKAIVRTT